MKSFEENISTLSTISVDNINKVKRYMQSIQSHEIVTHLVKENKGPVEIPLMEGKLLLTVDNDVISYKFIPNKEFEEIIINSFVTKKSLLVSNATSRLSHAFENIYKDIL